MKTNKARPAGEMKIEELARMAQVLRLLAHSHRLKIIDVLEAETAAPVHELMKRLNLPQSATSH
ncbi:MAG: hypothetical protein U1E27_05240, partial [Kiritimatiellia bacterium]|nr:hypothetical protein [Kiritimatiellia bacterium]